MGGIARGGRSGEGESDGEDESGVRARMRVRVRARRSSRHSAHRGCHDRRQLESEALSRHDARGHCDVHGALRRADLKLACGRTHAAHRLSTHDNFFVAAGVWWACATYVKDLANGYRRHVWPNGSLPVPPAQGVLLNAFFLAQ